MFVFSVMAQSGPLLKLGVTSRDVTLVRESIGVRVDMLLKVLVLRKTAAADLAHELFEAHMVHNQVPAQANSVVENFAAISHGAHEAILILLVLQDGV
jgi:hypothetical protein